ncbi:SDR family NAD(P)-dependent oxidoreductase [Microbacterium sp. 179-I 3D3 NHS]|uniref:SDR family NAD(P)-dependent oxidoreductase n=1 Tax=unclassified Microbacterium TaxID=2609290 RepID=UPI0039A31942
MTALVTGAAGAIGAAIVEQLVAAGHRVVAQDVSAERLERLSGESVVVVPGDLRDEALLAQLARMPELADLDRVIAAHGIEGSGDLASTTPDRVARIMSINAAAVVDLLGAVEDRLAANAGSFVAVCSQAGLIAEKDNIAYCASKFALVGWARAEAPRLAGIGLKLRLLCPGCTETPILFDALANMAAIEGVPYDDVVARRLHSIPTRTFASPAQTAASACYLADPLQPRPAIFAATGGEVLW